MAFGTRGQLIYELQEATGQLRDILNQQDGRLKQIQDSLTSIQEQINLINLRLDNLETVVGTCVITVTITAPTASATINGSVLFRCTVSDAGSGHTINKVKLFFDTAEIGDMTFVTDHWEKTVDTKNYANKSYTIKMRAFCNKGNTKEASQTNTIYNYIPPGGGGGTYGCIVGVNIHSPVTGTEIFPSGSFKLRALFYDSVGHGLKSISGSITNGGSIGPFSSVGGSFYEADGIAPPVTYNRATITVSVTCEQNISASSSVTIRDPTGHLPT